MMESGAWPWVGLLGLGVWHGANPAMGWLFAVALGMQEQRGRAVWRALGPLALGHAIAIGVTLVLAALIGLVVPLAWLKWTVAAVLVAWGVYRLVRNRHPRWVGMRVGPRDLTLWSMLMASAHGAGVMVLPFALGAMPPRAGLEPVAGAHHHAQLVAAALPTVGVWVTLVHTAGYLLITGLLAVIVYEKLGLRMLRSAWLNLDVIWGLALILTGLVTPLI